MPNYHYPKLSSFDCGLVRSPGPGLGNLLFPISRALIGVLKDECGIFVYPTVPQLKFGPLFRSETDKRMYWSIFKSRSSRQWIQFFRTWSIWDHLTEDDNAFTDPQDKEKEGNKVIEYEGLRNYFHDLEGFESDIKLWIEKNMVLSSYDSSASKVVVHVRQGDFSAYNASNIDTCYKTPFEWYVQALDFAKNNVDTSEPVLLLTDGDHTSVAEQLKLSKYTLPPTHFNALQTIMLGSKAEMLVASKSTFSMWMRFLGRGRVLWEPGFDIDKYFTVTERDSIFS